MSDLVLDLVLVSPLGVAHTVGTTLHGFAALCGRYSPDRHEAVVARDSDARCEFCSRILGAFDADLAKRARDTESKRIREAQIRRARILEVKREHPEFGAVEVAAAVGSTMRHVRMVLGDERKAATL